MPPEHGVVSSNLTGRATFTKILEKRYGQTLHQAIAGVDESSLGESRGEVHGSRKEGPALIKPAFSSSYDRRVTHALVEGTYESAGLRTVRRRSSADLELAADSCN